MRRALLLALVLPPLAGCGGGSSDGGATTPSRTGAPNATPPRGATPPGRPLLSPYDPPARVPRTGTGQVADPARVAVVRRWVDALRDGDVAASAATFADGARIQNGGATTTLRTAAQRRRYMDEGFPCGARVADAEAARDGWVIVGFTLTGRKGGDPYACGGGGRASAAVRVAGGRIRDWYRVPDPAPAGATPA